MKHSTCHDIYQRHFNHTKHTNHTIDMVFVFVFVVVVVVAPKRGVVGHSIELTVPEVAKTWDRALCCARQISKYIALKVVYEFL